MADFDCQTCGACCLQRWKSDCYVYLNTEDEARVRRLELPVILRQDSEDESDVNPHLGVRKLADGTRACVAFEGQPGSSCGCTIYEDRPTPCREFEAGTAACREARRLFGLPA